MKAKTPLNTKSPAPKTLKSSEVVKLTGVSPRQLQWWDELDYICPQHVGHSRFYSTEQVSQIKRAMTLRDRGLSLRASMRLAKGPADVDQIAEAIDLLGKYRVQTPAGGFMFGRRGYRPR